MALFNRLLKEDSLLQVSTKASTGLKQTNKKTDAEFSHIS